MGFFGGRGLLSLERRFFHRSNAIVTSIPSSVHSIQSGVAHGWGGGPFNLTFNSTLHAVYPFPAAPAGHVRTDLRPFGRHGVAVLLPCARPRQLEGDRALDQQVSPHLIIFIYFSIPIFFPTEHVGCGWGSPQIESSSPKQQHQ